MKLEAAIAKSPLGAASRPARQGEASVVAMKIRGLISIVQSVANPKIVRRIPTTFDLQSREWQPVAGSSEHSKKEKPSR